MCIWLFSILLLIYLFYQRQWEEMLNLPRIILVLWKTPEQHVSNNDKQVIFDRRNSF